MAAKVRGPRVEPTIVVLLSGDVIGLPSECLLIYLFITNRLGFLSTLVQ